MHPTGGFHTYQKNTFLYETVLQYFPLRARIPVFSAQQMGNDDSFILAKYVLFRMIVPWLFFLQNQNRDIFREDISFFVKIFSICKKLAILLYKTL